MGYFGLITTTFSTILIDLEVNNRVEVTLWNEEWVDIDSYGLHEQYINCKDDRLQRRFHSACSIDMTTASKNNKIKYIP